MMKNAEIVSAKYVANNISFKLEKLMKLGFEVIKVFSITLIDFKSNTLKNPITGKRLLNKLLDTPKMYKQIKENNTPRIFKQNI